MLQYFYILQVPFKYQLSDSDENGNIHVNRNEAEKGVVALTAAFLVPGNNGNEAYINEGNHLQVPNTARIEIEMDNANGIENIVTHKSQCNVSVSKTK